MHLYQGILKNKRDNTFGFCSMEKAETTSWPFLFLNFIKAGSGEQSVKAQSSEESHWRIKKANEIQGMCVCVCVYKCLFHLSIDIRSKHLKNEQIKISFLKQQLFQFFVSTISKFTLHTTSVMAAFLTHFLSSLNSHGLCFLQSSYTTCLGSGLLECGFGLPHWTVQSLRQDHVLYDSPSSMVPIHVFCIQQNLNGYLWTTCLNELWQQKYTLYELIVSRVLRCKRSILNSSEYFEVEKCLKRKIPPLTFHIYFSYCRCTVVEKLQ